MRHPRVTGLTNHRHFTFSGLKGVVLLFTYKINGWAKYGCLNAIFGCFGALRGSPWVTDGWCATPGQWWGRTNRGDLTFDGFKGAVSLFTYKKDGQTNSGYLGDFFDHLAAWGGPGVTNRWFATPGGWRGKKNQKDVTYYGFKGVVPCFTCKKMAETNLVITVVFLFALGLCGEPLWWWMDDEPP